MSLFKPKSKPPSAPPRKESGSFAAVAARKKMHSIDENTMPLIDEASQALDRVLATIPPTPEQAAEAEATVTVEFEEKPDDEK